MDDFGQVTWVEDELGYRTCHQFDAMGRLTKVTYPAETPQVCDESRWTPGVNVGQPHVFSNHCYLIKHAKGWMLWDTGNADRIAAMPSGFSTAGGAITAYM